jgi:hypothetical protein
VFAGAVFALPAMSVKLPAATLTVIVPLALGVGVTTIVACEPLMRLKPLAVPPVTVMSEASKLTPTSSLNTNVKVTGPLATGAETLLAIVTVGGVVSGQVPAPDCRIPAAAALRGRPRRSRRVPRRPASALRPAGV